MENRFTGKGYGDFPLIGCLGIKGILVVKISIFIKTMTYTPTTFAYISSNGGQCIDETESQMTLLVTLQSPT